jgi:hypothetical protein
MFTVHLCTWNSWAWYIYFPVMTWLMTCHMWFPIHIESILGKMIEFQLFLLRHIMISGNFGDRYFGTDYYEKEELSWWSMSTMCYNHHYNHHSSIIIIIGNWYKKFLLKQHILTWCIQSCNNKVIHNFSVHFFALTDYNYYYICSHK